MQGPLGMIVGNVGFKQVSAFLSGHLLSGGLVVPLYPKAQEIARQKGAVIGSADSCFVNQFNLVEGVVIIRGYGFVLSSVLPLVIARIRDYLFGPFIGDFSAIVIDEGRGESALGASLVQKASHFHAPLVDHLAKGIDR